MTPVMRLWYNSLGVGYHAYLPDGTDVKISEHFADPDMSMDEFITENTSLTIQEWDELCYSAEDGYTWACVCAMVNYCRKVGITHIWDEEFFHWSMTDELRAKCVEGKPLWGGDREQLVPVERYIEAVAVGWRDTYPNLSVETGRLNKEC